MPILNWLTPDEDIRTAQRVPYRLLEELPKLSAGDGDAGNMLIQGDNLEALKALLPFYAGRVKCIYIDPPYNTRSEMELRRDDGPRFCPRDGVSAGRTSSEQDFAARKTGHLGCSAATRRIRWPHRIRSGIPLREHI